MDDQVARLRPAVTKVGLVLFAATAAELLQGIGIPALGRTFDPRDLGMYAVGVGLAMALDRLVLTPLVPAWPLAVIEETSNDRPEAL